MRSHPAGLASHVRRALAEYAVDEVDAPPNYSLRLETSEPGRPGPARAYALYRSRCLLLRTRKRERVVRALVAALAGHAKPRTGLVRMRQLGVIGPSGAVLVPHELHWQVEGVERRLADHGLSFVDPPFVELDPETFEVVLSSNHSHVHGSVRGFPLASTYGRYPIVEWTILRRDLSARLGTHDALAALVPVVEAPTSTRMAVEALSRGLAATRVEPIWYERPAGLLARLLAAS